MSTGNASGPGWEPEMSGSRLVAVRFGAGEADVEIVAGQGGGAVDGVGGEVAGVEAAGGDDQVQAAVAGEVGEVDAVALAGERQAGSEADVAEAPPAVVGQQHRGPVAVLPLRKPIHLGFHASFHPAADSAGSP